MIQASEVMLEVFSEGISELKQDKEECIKEKLPLFRVVSE